MIEAEFAPIIGVVLFGAIFCMGSLWLGDFLRVRVINKLEWW